MNIKQSHAYNSAASSEGGSKYKMLSDGKTTFTVMFVSLTLPVAMWKSHQWTRENDQQHRRKKVKLIPCKMLTST